MTFVTTCQLQGAALEEAEKHMKLSLTKQLEKCCMYHDYDTWQEC